MQGMLFDDFQRTDEEAKAESCPTFAYWNDSARSDLSQVRAELERWYQRYPEQHRSGLRGRFRSTDDAQQRSAFFELFLHEALETEFGEVDVEPELGNGARPDFLISCGSERFFVEAVSTSELSAAQQGSEARRKTFRDVLDKIESNGFFLAVTILKESGQIDKKLEIEAFLVNWLETLDSKKRQGQVPEDPVPSCIWESPKGWKVKFEAYPRSQPGARSIGVRVDPVRELHHRERLLQSLKRKAKHYGDLKAPLLIAVDVESLTASAIDYREALFGQEELVVNTDGTERCSRKANGLWHTTRGPVNRGVSGAIFVQGLKWWTVKTAPATIYPNPWARYPYTGRLERLRGMEISGDHGVMRDGEPIGSAIPCPEIMAVSGLPYRGAGQTIQR